MSFSFKSNLLFRYEFVVRAGRTNPRHHKAEEREIEKAIREANKIDFPFFFFCINLEYGYFTATNSITKK